MSHPQVPTLADGTRIIDGNTRSPDSIHAPHGEGWVDTHLIHQDPNVRIERKLYMPSNVDHLSFTTFDYHDRINVSNARNHFLPANTLAVQINSSPYRVIPASAEQSMVWVTQGGDDQINILEDIANPVFIYSGAGHDQIISDTHLTHVYAGAGDDSVITRKGWSYVEGGEGDDMAVAVGDTQVALYGGPGNDFLSGSMTGGGSLFADGGEGDDHIVGGLGHSVLSGADGDDRIEAGVGSNVIYTGAGRDEVKNLKAGDVTYFSQNSTLDVDCNLTLHPQDPGQFAPGELASHAVHSEPVGLAHSGLSAQGSPSFIARVNDDLRLLLNAPTGKKLLAELERVALNNGQPVIIREFFPTPNDMFEANPTHALDAFIKDGKRGRPDDGGTVWYNTAGITPSVPPIITLFHELCHAYNYLTGSLLPGYSEDGEDNHRPRLPINNVELQAVGLPTTAAPFDFDNDPNTPPTNTNPEAFSENGLRKELGLPRRAQYRLD